MGIPSLKTCRKREQPKCESALSDECRLLLFEARKQFSKKTK